MVKKVREQNAGNSHLNRTRRIIWELRKKIRRYWALTKINRKK